MYPYLVNLAVVGLYRAQALKLRALWTQAHPVGLEVSFAVPQQQSLEGVLVVDAGDGAHGKFKRPVVLGLLQIDHLHVAIIEPPDDNNLAAYRGGGNRHGELLVIQADGAGL